MEQFYQWNRLAIKFSLEPKIALQISWWTENESGYVWMGKFDYGIRTRVDVEIFESAKKNLRIKKYPDTSVRGLKVRSHCHFNKVWQRLIFVRQWQGNLPKSALHGHVFFPVYQWNLLHASFSRYVTFRRNSSSPVALPCKTTIDMRRFRWKADDLMGKGRRKRSPQLLANREARIWKQLNLLSWMLATIVTKYWGSFAFKNPPSKLELCV